MMPEVTVKVSSSPSGLPMASTHSPTRASSLLPSGAGGQVVGVDLEDGHVGVGVGAHHLGLELPAVEQPDGDLLGALHHVVVGQDVAVRRDDEAEPLPCSISGCCAELRGKNCSKPGGTCCARWPARSAGTGCRPRSASRARPPRRTPRSGPASGSGGRNRRGRRPGAIGRGRAGPAPGPTSSAGRSSSPANSRPSTNARATRPPNFSQFSDRADIEPILRESVREMRP